MLKKVNCCLSVINIFNGFIEDGINNDNISLLELCRIGDYLQPIENRILYNSLVNNSSNTFDLLGAIVKSYHLTLLKIYVLDFGFTL